MNLHACNQSSLSSIANRHNHLARSTLMGGETSGKDSSDWL
jgi:hypothetical protein